ncbi:MAG: hypothetical protein H7836_18035, partial [Magnetococcus sp. YQC-3]
FGLSEDRGDRMFKKTYKQRIDYGRKAGVYRKIYKYHGKRYASKYLSKNKYAPVKKKCDYWRSGPLFKNKGW